jgi:nucleoside-diphosphate-sugar epimerase
MSRNLSNILVTGGAGFIGSHIVDTLLHENFEVTIIDSLSTGNLKNIGNHKNEKSLHFIKCDIRDYEIVKKAMQDIDAVLHEAALVSVPMSVEDPTLTEDVNVKGTLNLLKASLDLDVKRFVFASSAAVYGDTPSIWKRENMVTKPTSPYGVCKLAAENFVRLYYELYGIETVSLRYFNVYGPRQNLDVNSSYSAVIPIFANRLSRDLPAIVYGDGEQTRDFVFVRDVVEANVLALKSNKAAGEVFNIGTATRVTVNQIADFLKRIMNKKYLENLYLSPRPTDVRHVCADIGKAKRILGYTPKFSMKEGLVEFVKWHRGIGGTHGKTA